MNWVFINGSPRKDGNTNYLINQIAEKYIKLNQQKTIIEVYEKDIHPCDDCRRCKAGDYSCPVNDDMKNIYPVLNNSGVIVFGSPVYWSGVTGPMKNFIDRLRPYYGNKKLKDKKAIIITVGTNADEEHDLITEMYKRITGLLNIQLIGNVVMNGFDIGDIEKKGMKNFHINFE